MASRPTVRSMRTMIVPSGGRHSARAFARSGRGGGDATGGPLRKTQKTLPNFQVVLERFVVQNLRRALTPQRCMVSPNLIHILILPELTSCFPANSAPFSYFFFFGQQECLGTSYVVCGACRGRGKVGGLLDTSVSKGERCETCDGEGILACQECNATGIKNNWLFQPAKDPGWGPRGEP